MDLYGEDSVDLNHIELLSAVSPAELSSHFPIIDPSAILNGVLPGNNTYTDTQHPYVEIVEQPQQRGFRFRYECEGPSHGGLQGKNTDPSHKTYTAIKVVNYEGPARIEVSLVTTDEPPCIHAHKLVGKNCENGVCRMDIASTASIISFPSLCIQHVTRKKAVEVLLHHILEDNKLNKQLNGTDLSPQSDCTAEEIASARKQAQQRARSMVLNKVRLQFRVFLPSEDGQYLTMLPPVVSQPIYDSKSPAASVLKICRMDKVGGCCTGNEEVFLLCEKVQKEDIAVRFVEYGSDGDVKWEANANFSPLDVHRQYAIVFKTPPYINTSIDKAVNVMIMLQRKSDKEVSEGKVFTYYPQNRDKDWIVRKKRKKLPLESVLGHFSGEGGTGAGAGGPSVDMGARFDPLGLTGFGGGSGMRDTSHGSHRVIMPNGNIFDQLNVLPTTVEQAVKEEFSNIPQAAPHTELHRNYVDPLDHFFNNDLEMDAAHSLRYPSQMVARTTRHPASAQKTKTPCGVGMSNSQRKSPESDKQKKNSVLEKQKKDPADDKRKENPDHDEKNDPAHDKEKKYPVDDKEKKDPGDEKQKKDPDHGKQKRDLDHEKKKKDLADGKQKKDPDSQKHTRTAPVSDSAATNRKNNARCEDDPVEPERSDPSPHKGEGSDKVHGDRSNEADEPPAVQSTDQDQPAMSLIVDSGEVGETGDGVSVHSIPSKAEAGRRLGDVTLSEGVRIGEGSSDALEASSVREDHQQQQQKRIHVPPKTSKEEGGEEVTSAPERAATAVVKRIVQRITAKTVLALQDYSETGDARYLLLVQRHLTAIKNENGDLPLHLAVINSQTTALRHLLTVMLTLPKAGHLINSYNYIRQTALHLAAIMHQPLHIELLLHAGADPSLPDRNGNMPAHLAVLNNSMEGLHSLVKYLRPEVTASDPFPELDCLNYDGYSPVHLAAQKGSVDMLRLLVHGQADVDLGDGKSGRTALHHAVELDDLPVAGFLLMEANADVNAKCFDGNTPLHVACCRGLMGMVALLMTAGAQTDVENEEVPLGDNGGEGEGGEEKSRHHPRRGLQPKDYVFGKDKLRIMRMLMGDFPGEVSKMTDDPDLMDDPDLLVDPVPKESDLEQDLGDEVTRKVTFDSGVSLSATSQSGASFPAKEKLTHEDHLALSKLLDPENAGKDVLELARRLGFDSLVSALEAMAWSGSSPTMYLLDYNETYGSLSRLRECLQAMERDDAVQVVDRRT